MTPPRRPTTLDAEPPPVLNGPRAALLLTTLAVLWVVVVVATPLALAQGYAVLPAMVYQLAAGLCHQRPERSFHLAGIQLPVCARCLGLYASGAAGAVAAFGVAAPIGLELHRRRSTAVLALAAAPTALTVAGEWLNLVHPGGMLRAVAALPLGLAAGWLFVRALRAAPEGV
jgi:uncharacterized membrane protein